MKKLLLIWFVIMFSFIMTYATEFPDCNDPANEIDTYVLLRCGKGMQPYVTLEVYDLLINTFGIDDDHIIFSIEHYVLEQLSGTYKSKYIAALDSGICCYRTAGNELSGHNNSNGSCIDDSSFSGWNKGLRWLKRNADENDKVIIIYSGHGETNNLYTGSPTLTHSELVDTLKAIKHASMFFSLNACYADNFRVQADLDPIDNFRLLASVNSIEFVDKDYWYTPQAPTFGSGEFYIQIYPDYSYATDSFPIRIGLYKNSSLHNETVLTYQKKKIPIEWALKKRNDWRSGSYYWDGKELIGYYDWDNSQYKGFWDNNVYSSTSYFKYTTNCNCDTSFKFYFDPRVQYGELGRSTVWDADTIFVVGDVTVPSGDTLTIKANTVVWFSSSDILSSGSNTSKCEIRVSGVLKADSVKFIGGNGNNDDWASIYFLYGSSDNSYIKHSELKDASYPIEICGPDVTIESNEIYNVKESAITVSNDAFPTVYDNYIHNADTGINSFGGSGVYRYNTINNVDYGVIASSTSHLEFRGIESAKPYGMNKFTTNDLYPAKIYAGYAAFGWDSPSYKNGHNDMDESFMYSKIIYALSTCNYNIGARHNYFYSSSPNSSWFQHDNTNYTIYWNNYSTSSFNAGSSLDKASIYYSDAADLMSKGEELFASKDYVNAYKVFKDVIARYPDFEETYTAVYWAMSSARRAGIFFDQEEYLASLFKHTNPAVASAAKEWTLNIICQKGDRARAKKFISGFDKNSSLGKSLRLQYAINLRTMFGDTLAANQVFSALKKDMPEIIGLERSFKNLGSGRAELAPGGHGIGSGNREIENGNIAAYPNPFNAETQLVFTLNEPQRIRVDIYNILGQRVKTLIDSNVMAGKHRVVWDGRNQYGEMVSTGIYLVRFTGRNLSKVIKIAYVR